MKPLSCPYSVTTKGCQEQFPGKSATIFLRSDEAATRCMFLCGYYSRAACFFSIGKLTDINDGWILKVRISDKASDDC